MKEAAAILRQLDDCAGKFVFPMLDNGYLYLIDARMTIFSSADHWAITIEVIGFSPRGGGHNGISNAVHIYGNFPGCNPGLQNENIHYFTQDVGGQNAFEEEYAFYLNPAAKHILIAGEAYELVHDRQRYLSEEITLEEKDNIGIQEYLRLIWPQVEKKPFLSDEELLKITHSSLTKRLQLNDWWHPDLVKEEFPSEVETFPEIARAIANDDFNGLGARLTRKGNTAWRNWPEGGTM